MSHLQTTYTAAKQTSRGLRIWIEGQKLALAGFTPAARYQAVYDAIEKRITLTLDANGGRKVTESKRGGVARPIIDLQGAMPASVFDAGTRIRVTFSHGLIEIVQHHESSSQTEREARFNARSGGGTIVECSMFTGGAISTDAISSAISAAGHNTRIGWVCEMESKYIESAGQNCAAIDDSTTFLVGKAEEIEAQLYTQCDILSFSMPCAGFSKAGRVKHGQTPEQHSGTALFGVINAIKNANPAVLISENVTEAMDSPMYTLLTAELRRTGYRVFEQILDQRHTGTVENRRRYWMVAVSEGIAPEQLELLPVDIERPSIDSLLESDPCEPWCVNEGLKDKAVRDAAAGKGFAKRQLLTGSENRCGTIGRFYSKKRSTEPFIVNSDGLERLLTPVEHCRVKSVPEHLIGGLGKCVAHEILGQSVDYRQPFNLTAALFAALGGAA